MRLLSIASGSSGNCIYIDNDDTAILIDTGISKKRILEGLDTIGVNPAKLSGILITHEHSDHICGLGVMARAYKIPMYATIETFDAILNIKSMGKVDTSLFNCIEPDRNFAINDMIIRPFAVSHDAANPVCYNVNDASGKVAVATDLGYYDEYIISNLMDSNILLLESNHDINMVQVGSYPYPLKQRILSDKGHLSNENSGRLISKLVHKDLKHVLLGHLSHENNYPDLAYETVKSEIIANCGDFFDKLDLQVASRVEPSRPVTIQ